MQEWRCLLRSRDALTLRHNATNDTALPAAAAVILEVGMKSLSAINLLSPEVVGRAPRELVQRHVFGCV